MKTALTAALVLAAATSASLSGDLIESLTNSIVNNALSEVRPSYQLAPQPGYIVYSDYSAALPRSDCYWTRIPIYGSNGGVIGWLGQPAAVCPQ
jgi:hypothetical protein